MIAEGEKDRGDGGAGRKGRTLAWEATGLVSSSGLPPYNTSPVKQMREGAWSQRDAITGAGAALCRSLSSVRDTGQCGSL